MRTFRFLIIFKTRKLITLDKNLYLPDQYRKSITHIDFDELYQKGINNLIIDVDNTIALKGRQKPEEESEKVLRKLLDSGIGWKICLVSNIVWGRKREKRVEAIAKHLRVPFVCANLWNRKPSPAPFQKGMSIMKADKKNTAVIGDQIFTDVLGGNRLELYTILVEPLGDDHWTTKLTGRRNKESKIIKEWKFGSK